MKNNLEKLKDDIQDNQHLTPLNNARSKFEIQYNKTMAKYLWYSYNKNTVQAPYNDITKCPKVLLQRKYDPHFRYIIRKTFKLERNFFKDFDNSLSIENFVNKEISYEEQNFCTFYYRSGIKSPTSLVLDFVKHIRNSFAHGRFNVKKIENKQIYYNNAYYEKEVRLALKLFAEDKDSNIFENLDKKIKEIADSKLPILDECLKLADIQYERADNMIKSYFIQEGIIFNIENISRIDDLFTDDFFTNDFFRFLLYENHDKLLKNIYIYLEDYNYNISNEKTIEKLNQIIIKNEIKDFNVKDYNINFFTGKELELMLEKVKKE